MAEDPQLASRTPTAANDVKRKYEDTSSNNSQTTPPARRATGFSAPIASPSPDSHAPPPSYNNVPPPADADFQLAKQRAQEIAARIFSNAEAKRPRIENGGSDDSSDFAQKPQGQQLPNTQVGQIPQASLPVAYGFQGSSKKIDIPNGRVGVIIGKGGETIKYLQLQSGAKIQVTRDMDADPTSPTRLVELIGTPEQISKAEQLVNDVLAEAEAGGSGILAARRFSTAQSGAEQFTMKVPNNKVGLIIGKGGETIKNMQARSGARIQLIPLHPPPGDTSPERTVQIDGTKEQIESAKQLVNEVISENRLRNPQVGGGYTQQGFRPPRPPTNWGPPGQPPMQQPGYGYMQPGAYPGPPPQYNMSQGSYSGYPAPPSSGSYPSGWDQTSAPANPQSVPSGGYDYYGQQTQQQHQPAPGGSSAPADNNTYNYGQPPPSNYNPQGPYGGESTYSQPSVGQQQGYSQDGYGGGYSIPGPQPGYSQPQSNPQSGYEHQGYGSAPTYATMPNPNQDGAPPSYGGQAGPTPGQPPAAGGPAPVPPPTAGQQGYPGQQPTTPSYASQGGTQPGYGMPPTSQPGYGSQPPPQAGYGQTQPGYGPPQMQKPPTQGLYGQNPPAPTSQGSYMQPMPGQPGYAHSQPPPSTQSGYVQQDPSHHRAPLPGFGSSAPQPGYGQQQPYGVQPAAQPGYGQQQQQQQPYVDSYGGGYTQPPAYATDGTTAGGSTHVSYDAPPGAQPAATGAVAKASPKN